MRIVVHAQHLSGVGHHVRAVALARALATAHDVVLVDGGAPVPLAPLPPRVARAAVPGLRRGPAGLAPLDGDGPVAPVLAERVARLRALAADVAPDVVLVEHFPFSKWELRDEVLALLAAARAARPTGLAVASVRDLPLQTRHERVAPDAWRAAVAADLDRHFDGVLVHGDPRLGRLADVVPGADAWPVPVEATGFVVETPPSVSPSADVVAPGTRFAVASAGGAGGAAFQRACVEAWRQGSAAGAFGGRTLVVFTGLAASEGDREALRAAAGDAPVVVVPFRADFVACLAHADLSVSRAGYNTCAALLATRRRAVLVPDPAMSDQAERARRFAARGVATVVEPARADAATLAAAFVAALARPPPTHDLDLDGAAASGRVIERWVRAGPRTRAAAPASRRTAGPR